MKKILLLRQEELKLPDINSIDKSELAFSEAFLRVAQILCRHLQKIKSSIEIIPGFKQEPVNLAILCLFSKMSRNYYSYVLLEIHQDQIGSQFLIEHLCEAAITITYLLEAGDKSLFSDYICASVHQARFLLLNVEEQLQHVPNHPELVSLRDKLQSFINNQQQQVANQPLKENAATHRLWGPEEANTTAKRASLMGLDFLTNRARQTALRITPASWLELQLNYWNSFTNNPVQGNPGTNFKHLRDTAYLCLHVAQTFLEEVVNTQTLKLAEMERQQRSLNMLYEWFHNAYNAYCQQCCCATIPVKDESTSL